MASALLPEEDTMKKLIKRLALSKETVRTIADPDLAFLQGGKPEETILTRCVKDGSCDFRCSFRA